MEFLFQPLRRAKNAVSVCRIATPAGEIAYPPLPCRSTSHLAATRPFDIRMSPRPARIDARFPHRCPPLEVGMYGNRGHVWARQGSPTAPDYRARTLPVARRPTIDREPSEEVFRRYRSFAREISRRQLAVLHR